MNNPSPKKKPATRIVPISVAQYPGRKHWFVPKAAKFFRAYPCRTLIEPFAGSGVVGFSLLYAGIIERLVLVERSKKIERMLHGIVHDSSVAERYAAFECTRENVIDLLRREQSAFSTLVETRCKNRAKVNGGFRTTIDERFCREMVVRNLRRIQTLRERITVIHGDGLELIRRQAEDPATGCFCDPPYSTKGRTLYVHHKLDHQRLFSQLRSFRGPWLLTEDNCRTVRRLARCYRFDFKRVPMTDANNHRQHELMIWCKRRIF
jgi:DNA adenine methylase